MSKWKLTPENLRKFKRDVKVYLAINEIKLADFAAKLKIARHNLYNILNGRANGGELFWHRIEQATQGQIKKENYYD